MSKLLTVIEASTFLKVSPSTIYRYCEKGILPHIKKSFGLRFQKNDIEYWLDQDKKKITFVDNFLKKALTNSPPIDIHMSKGGQSKLAKKGQTCFNYGFGSIYTREMKSGGPRWYIYYYDENGKRTREVVSKAFTKEEALIALKEKVLGVISKKSGNERIKKKIGFRDFAQSYLQDYIKENRRNFQTDVYRLERLTEFFGDIELRRITIKRIREFRNQRFSEGNSKSTTNRYLALLKAMLNFAIEEGYLEENPVRKVKLYSEKDTIIEQVLKEEKESLLVKTSSGYIKSILITALNTGMRRGEILSLKWNQIDFTNRRIRVEKTKSGKMRFIPVNDVLLDEILNLRRTNGQSPFVFLNPKTGKPLTRVDKSFKSACRRAGIEAVRFHDLRHTFASRLVEKGVDIETIKELLGHYSITVTQRYTHSNDDRKRKAVELLSRRDKKREPLTHHRHMEEQEPSQGSSEKPLRCLFSAN